MPRKVIFRAICGASRCIDGPELARDVRGTWRGMRAIGPVSTDLEKHVVRRWRAFSRNGPDSLCTVSVVQISVKLGLAWCGAVGAKSSKSSIPLAGHVPSVSNVINLDFIFRTRILSPSNSSGVLRYGSEPVSERSVCCADGRWGSFEW